MGFYSPHWPQGWQVAISPSWPYGFPYVKTTLNIDDQVMVRLKREAARRKTSMSELVETALRLFLQARRSSVAPLEPLPTFDGGGTEVDISNRESLYRAMEGR